MAKNDTPWLSPEELRSWIPLMAMLMTLPAALDAQLKRDGGLNLFEYMVLAALSDAPDRTMQSKELATMSQGSLSRISHAVTRLENAGWVERRPSNAGGRHMDVRMTAAGARKIRQAAPGHVREARRLVVDAVTPAQFRMLGAAARVVLAATDEALAVQLDQHLPG